MNFDVIKTKQRYNLTKLKNEVNEILSKTGKNIVSLSGNSQDYDLYNFYTGPLINTKLKEEDFKYLHPSLKNTEIEKIWNNNIKTIGRFRIIKLTSGQDYTLHVDADYRYHLCITTNDQSHLEIDSKLFHILPDGFAYLCNTRKLHRAMNYGTTDRIHLIWNDRNCE